MGTPFYRRVRQYQIRAESPPRSFDVQQFESTFHYPWSEPVRPNPLLSKGLLAPFQQFYTAPSRYLPPPDVTAVMSAEDPPVIDTGNADIWVYDDPLIPVDLTALKVSIAEVPSDGVGASTSIKEVEP